MRKRLQATLMWPVDMGVNVNPRRRFLNGNINTNHTLTRYRTHDDIFVFKYTIWLWISKGYIYLGCTALGHFINSTPQLSSYVHLERRHCIFLLFIPNLTLYVLNYRDTWSQTFVITFLPEIGLSRYLTVKEAKRIWSWEGCSGPRWRASPEKVLFP